MGRQRRVHDVADSVRADQVPENDHGVAWIEPQSRSRGQPRRLRGGVFGSGRLGGGGGVGEASGVGVEPRQDVLDGTESFRIVRKNSVVRERRVARH